MSSGVAAAASDGRGGGAGGRGGRAGDRRETRSTIPDRTAWLLCQPAHRYLPLRTLPEERAPTGLQPAQGFGLAVTPDARPPSAAGGRTTVCGRRRVGPEAARDVIEVGVREGRDPIEGLDGI